MSSKIRAIFSENIESRWFLPTVFLASTVLFVLRKPIFVLIQPGRVEDVDVLVREAIQYSWGSIFVVYNYYLHFVPRLVTISSLYLFGISNVNLAMNITAIIIATLCALFFATKQFRFIIKNDFLRAVCSLFIVAAPGINEIYSNISSIQWFLNIFTMLFVLLLLFRYEEYKKQSKKKKCLYVFFCSASVLSSAFSIVFLPALIYVIIREVRKNEREIITISSYVIPTIFSLLQALLIYINYSQQFKSSALQITIDIIRSTIQIFSTSVSTVFYQNIFQNFGDIVYLIPIVVIGFILLNSIKNGLRFEIFTLYCITATLFLSILVRGGMAERFMSFAVIFLFILVVRQFDKRKSLSFKLIFVAIMIIIISNIGSGFFIPSSADENWKYVTDLYNPSGQYHCYVGEIPHGWAIFIPCSNPMSNNTMVPSSSTSFGPSITFTPPIMLTTTSIESNIITISGIVTTFTATILPIPDTGVVQFYIDDIPTKHPITVLRGQSIFSTSTLPTGIHHISASYLGAPNFYASTSSQTTITVLPISGLHNANLSRIQMQGVNLSGINLQGANLSGANLQNANFSNANLHDVNLSGALLFGANLRAVDLSGANLKGVILSGVNLSGANLTNTDLRDANTRGANFTDTITNGCNGCPQK
ncbi:MAG TPA: pentapeptide repeat-containing protein [Candidatus Nitrosotalea sp.]|nr:pentapeptide repeat-containing protein [Candidatus Nitrosotalea sp.]